MQPRLKLRLVVYAALLLPALALLAFCLSLCLRNGEVPGSVVNSRILSRLAQRFGVAYSVRSLRFGCFLKDCKSELAASGIQITLQDVPLHVDVDSVHWCPSQPLALGGIQVRRPDSAGTSAAVERIELRRSGTILRNLNIAVSPETTVAVREIDAASPAFARDTRTMSLGSVRAAGVDVRVAELSPAANVCRSSQTLLAAGDAMTGRMRQSLDAVNRSLVSLHRSFLYAALILVAVFFLLKLLVSSWVRGWRSRLGLAAVAVAAPLAVYFLAPGLSLRRLVPAAFACSLALAVFLRFRVYRHARFAYQRWEPFAVDLVCCSLVLPLALYALDFGSPFALPGKLTIGRVDVADLSVRGLAAQCGVDQPVAAALNTLAAGPIDVELPGTSAAASTVRIGNVDLPDNRIIFGDAVFPVSALVDDIRVGVDWPSRRILQLGARIQLSGSADPAGVLKPLRRIRFLRPLLENVSPLDFGINARLSSGAGLPGEIDPAELNSALPLALAAAVRIDTEDCSAQYAWAARVTTAPARMVSAGSGDAQHVAIRTLQTLPGSAFQIARASGSVSLSGHILARLRIDDSSASLPAARVKIRSTEVSASTGSPCGPVREAVVANLEGSQVEAGNTDATIARTEIRFNRTAARQDYPTSAVVRFLDAGIRTHGGDGPQIAAGLPAIAISFEGGTSPETIPRRLEGALDWSLATASEVFLRNTSPLKIAVDLWDGAFQVPGQNLMLHQTLAPQIPADLTLTMSLEGRLPARFPGSPSMRGRVAMSELPVDLGPVQLNVRDLEVAGDSVSASGSAEPLLTYRTGWNAIRLPGLPNVFCFDAVPELDLATEGDVHGLSLGDPSRAFAIPRRCIEGPAAASDRRFRVEGEWPGLLWEDASGFGVRIPDLSRIRLQEVEFNGGRLQSLRAESLLSGIRPVAGAGSIGAATRIETTSGSPQIAMSLNDGNGNTLADFSAGGQPQNFQIDVRPHVAADVLLAELQPFLSSAGIDMGRIRPQARVALLHTGLHFNGRKLQGLDATIDLDPGPLASIRLSESSPFQQIDAALRDVPGGRNRFRMSLKPQEPTNGSAPIRIQADLSQLNLRMKDARGGELETIADIHAAIDGTVNDRMPENGPVLDALSEVLRGMGRHLNSARRVFGEQSPWPLDVDWKFRLHGSDRDKPPLELAGNLIGLRLASDIERLTWRGRARETSSIEGAARLDADLTVHEGQLVADVRTPLKLRASLGSLPPASIDLDIPLEVAFSDRLPDPTDASELWDSGYYERFWQSYRPARMTSHEGSRIDFPSLDAGPISIRQITFPVQPLQLAVGYGERLAWSLPVASRALFGKATGIFQASVDWRGTQAVLNARLNLALKNIQAGAIGLDTEAGAAPFVEDEFDGELALQTNNWVLDGSVARSGSAWPSAMLPGALEALSLRLSLRKSERSAGVPGMIQLSSDTQINTLNRLLNRVVRDLRFAVPPQRMFYNNAVLDFRVDQGRILTDAPWLTLEGLRMFSSRSFDLESNIRLHGGRNGERLALLDLLGPTGGK